MTLYYASINNNNNYNTHICIAPYGRNFRGAVARECASESEKREESKPERKKRNVFSLDLKTVIELLSIIHMFKYCE